MLFFPNRMGKKQECGYVRASMEIPKMVCAHTLIVDLFLIMVSESGYFGLHGSGQYNKLRLCA